MLPLPTTTDTYERDIFAYLNDMQPGTHVVISNIAKTENVKKFIDVVKKYIDHHWSIGTFNANNILLSNDYKAVIKR